MPKHNEPFNQDDHFWPFRRVNPSPSDTQVARIFIHDWRRQRFDEECIADPDAYPIYGWLRTCLEETRSGVSYETREWRFGVDYPAAVQVKAVA